MLVCCRHLEALWVLSEPSSGMSDLLVYGMQLEAPWVLSNPGSGMTDLLGHALATQD
jgi:hypothetical protein